MYLLHMLRCNYGSHSRSRFSTAFYDQTLFKFETTRQSENEKKQTSINFHVQFVQKEGEENEMEKQKFI